MVGINVKIIIKKGVELLNKGKTIQISDTIHGSVRLNYLEKQVISTQIFNRLHNISQNSTVYLTFPTNRTKRFEHSIGTMSLCGRIFQDSISNCDLETLDSFFKNIESIIDTEIDNNLFGYADKYRSKIGDRNLSANKIKIYKSAKIPEEYNSFIPINVAEKYRNIYVILFQAIRLSALMHDVGHPPFSHITEFALKNIWEKINKIDVENRNERQNKYITSMENYFCTEQDLHEQIGNKITQKVLDDIIEKIETGQESNNKIIGEQIFKVIVGEVTSAILQEKHKSFGELHRIIDGTLDGDRLDYVSRDPLNSGLNVGIIEYDRIISSMRLSKVDDSFIFSPSSKVIDSIDDFFNRRWKMYKQIIYHHRVIKTDYLLQRCIEELALAYLYENVDEEPVNNILPYDISGLWKAIEEKASYKDYFDSLIQWDDSWLMTIMKKHYFDQYMSCSDNNTFYMLEELLANKKNYYSIIKRMEDFVVIDKQVAKIMAEEYDEINNIINEIKSNDTSAVGKVIINVDYLLNNISKLENVIKEYNESTSYIPRNGFILSKMKKIYNNLFEDGWLEKIIYDSVEELKANNIDINDTITIIKKVKTGIQGGKTSTQGGLGLYTNRNDNIEIINFSDLSNQGNMLNTDTEFMPVFYLYILKEKDNLDYKNIKLELASSIGKSITEKVKNRLKSLK